MTDSSAGDQPISDDADPGAGAGVGETQAASAALDVDETGSETTSGSGRAEATSRPRRRRGRAKQREVLRPAGWRIVAAKEFADNVRSVRFIILLVLVFLAALAAVQSASGALQANPRDDTELGLLISSPFLRLFSDSESLPSMVSFVSFLGPLLGIAFGFDAINNERAQGTLARLVSQPIHRDDVINGKFAAGLTLIFITFASLSAIVAGLGMFQLAVVPDAGEVARLTIFVVVTVIYVGLWLALAITCSVLLRRAATSALSSIAIWLVFTIFSTLLVGIISDAIAPVNADSTVEEQLRNARIEQTVGRFSPQTLYEEVAGAILNPETFSLDILVLSQLEGYVVGPLPLTQSLLLAWPQITALVAGIVILFAIAYLAFMRQEIRA